MSLTTQERSSLLASVDSLRAAIEAILVSDIDVPALQAELAVEVECRAKEIRSLTTWP